MCPPFDVWLWAARPGWDVFGVRRERPRRVSNAEAIALFLSTAAAGFLATTLGIWLGRR